MEGFSVGWRFMVVQSDTRKVAQIISYTSTKGVKQ